jgi:hypothetical protein
VAAVVATLRTLGVLVTLWAVLALVGLIGGVIPPPSTGVAGDPSGVEPEDEGPAPETPEEPAVETEETPATAEAETVAAPEEGEAGEEPVPDVVVGAHPAPEEEGSPGGLEGDGEEIASADPAADPTEAAEPPTGTPGAPVDARSAPRWDLCAAPEGQVPSLAAVDLFGDARDELVVGCPAAFLVLAWGGDRLLVAARFPYPPAPAGQRIVPGPARAGDVDGDPRSDLLLSLSFRTEAGATRGGLFAWVGRTETGALRAPRTLAPISAVDAAFLPDGGFVALHRTNPLAQLPSEAWVFSGGPAPTRTEALPLAPDGQRVFVLDFDRDGHDDVLALGHDAVDVHFGDGEGSYPRTHRFSLPGVREVAVGDLDGDGALDFATLGQGIAIYRAGPLTALEPRRLDGVPAGLRDLSAADLGDGALALVGWDHPRLAVLAQPRPLGFEPRRAMELVGGDFGPRRLVLTDADADGRPQRLALLGQGESGRLQLVVVDDPFAETTVRPEAARPVAVAPLVLEGRLRE